MKKTSKHMHTFLSPAKVNLFIRVLRKRADGYHDIMSLMQPISLYDEISLDIREGRGISIECDNISIPVDRTNLAFKAAEAFLKATGIEKKILIRIKKNIPVAAGLGGGSSNAATVLMALNELTSLNLAANDLAKIGLAIGSDVPFFLVGKPCLAKGRGEILEPVELPKFWYVLINPGFPVSTQWVYQTLDKTGGLVKPKPLFSDFIKDKISYFVKGHNLNLTKNIENINMCVSKVSKNIAAIQGLLINDLETVTISKQYEIQELKDALLALDATGALMSGSGPTVFGVFLDKGRAKKTFEQIKKDTRFKDMAVFIAQGL